MSPVRAWLATIIRKHEGNRMAFGNLITTEESAALHAASVNAALDGPPVLRTAFRQLQSETLMFAFAGVFGGSLALLAMATRVADPSWAVATAVLMLALLLAAWWLRSRSLGATSALLVTATLSGVIIMVTWGHVPAAICLLAIPIGLTTVLLGAGRGIGMAHRCNEGHCAANQTYRRGATQDAGF